MKRFTALAILLSLLLTGCAERLKEPVTFYYVRNGYEEDMADILRSEQREAAGHREDLSYLMALYLMGPADEDLRSPLPRGTNIFTSEYRDSMVTLRISDTTKTMTDAQFTLACSCLTLTCLELVEAESVTVVSGDRSITMNADSLTLKDHITGTQTEETQ